jgi:hypothetical protein
VGDAGPEYRRQDDSDGGATHPTVQCSERRIFTVKTTRKRLILMMAAVAPLVVVAVAVDSLGASRFP